MTTDTLGTLASEYARLDELLSASEGEVTPDIEAEIDALGERFQVKVERVALYVLGQLAKAKAIKEEEDRLSARRRAITTAADNLKAYLERIMLAVGTKKVDGVLATVALQLNGPSVVAPEWDEAALRGMAMYAPQFVTRKPETFALNRAAVLDAHRAGQPIPEGVTIERSQSLRIR